MTPPTSRRPPSENDRLSNIPSSTSSSKYKNPFPGPQPYRASEKAWFFGRDDLAYKLEGSVLANRCTTIYGPSGAGKSSLMQAAVIPALVASREIRVVRVDGWPDDKDPTRWLANAIYSDLELGEPPGDAAPDEAIAMAAQRTARRSSRLVLIYLDQIEQLLYASRSAAATDAFFDCVDRLIELPLRNLRAAISLREDYLGRFRDRLRDKGRILDHGLRVGPLTVAELCDAVCRAAASGEPPQTWSPDAMRALMLQVRVPGQSESDDAETQAAYAQIVCRALFKERALRGGDPSGSEPDAAHVEAEPILRRYFEATLEGCGPLRELATRVLEEHLITPDGIRTLRTESELARSFPSEELGLALKTLEDAAILRAEDHQGSRYFELGHDWLAKRVHEGRLSREREEQQQAELSRQRVEAEARLEKARAQKRQLRVVAFASLAVAAATGALGVWALHQKSMAEDQRRLAVDERIEAHDASILAGVRELAAKGELAWGIKLMIEVERPELLRGWVEMASIALHRSALYVTLTGHDAAVNNASFSPDGARVVTSSSDKTARVWKADGAGAPVVLRGHEGAVEIALWSPDGERVVTASKDGTARVWKADTATSPVILRGHEGSIVHAAMSPDGARVATASRDKTARVFDSETGRELLTLRGHEGALTWIVWSPDGARVVTASEDTTVRIWDASAAAEPVVLRDHTDVVGSLSMSPDGTRFVTASRDMTARVFSVAGTGSAVVLKGHTGGVFRVAFSPDGTHVATASADRTVRVYNADDPGDPVVLSGHELAVSALAWSPDGKYIATASIDGVGRIFAADGVGPSFDLRGHAAPIRSIVWSRDGDRVLTAAAADKGDLPTENTAKVWSAELARAIPRRRHGERFFHSAFVGSDGRRVASAYDDNTAGLWDREGRDPPVIFRGHTAWVTSAALSPDGKRVVTASFDKTARIWSADGSGEADVLRGHDAEVRYAAWSPDGQRVVTASEDGIARVFRADGGGAPILLKGHEDWISSAAWSPDGARIVTTSLDRTARVHRADGSGAPVVLSGHEGEVNAAAFSPDGGRVATACDDGAARVFRSDGGGKAILLRGHQGSVLYAAWSPNGQRLATAGWDKTVRVWNADGKGEPLVFEAPAPVIALTFLDGGRSVVGVASDNSTHTWMIDVEALRARLAAAHADCLPAPVRVRFLRETAMESYARYVACERTYKRMPILSRAIQQP